MTHNASLRKQQIEELIGSTIPDDQWEAMSAWWDAVRGLPLDRQQKLWKAAALAYKTQQQDTRKAVLADLEQRFHDFWSDESIKQDYAFHPSLLFRIIEETRNG